jgi:carboxylesterase
MAKVMPGAEPFLYEGNDVGCLLLHGFTGTPQEMRRLGHFLHGCGFTVLGALVAGHGTDPRELNETTWRDWYGSAYQGWQTLHESCQHVFAIGQSLGGSLSLHLAAHIPLSGVVTMAAPLILQQRLLWLARALRYVLPYRKKGLSNIRDPEALARRVAYKHTPTRSSEQALLFFRHLSDDLPEVHIPALLLHSRHDLTVHPSMMPQIYTRLGTGDKEMVWLENSGHVVTEDYDRELVEARIRTFIEKHT